MTDVAEQVLGTDVAAELDPAQLYGITAARRAAAVRKAAYDQVRSRAERGLPSSLENSSPIDPL
jgi:hypothetical protein